MFSETRIKKLGPQGEREKGLLALTGTLRTTPREMNVGYVMAMPKFIRTLKAVEGQIRVEKKTLDVLIEH